MKVQKFKCLYTQTFYPFPFSDFCIVNIQAKNFFKREGRKNSPSTEKFSSKCRNGGGWHSGFTLQLPDSAAAITNWALILWPLGPAYTDHAVIWTHPDSSSRVEAPQGRVIQTKNVILLFHEHLPTSVTMTPALPTSSFGEYKSVVGVTSFLKSWISGIAYYPHFSLQTSSSSLHFISTSWRSNNYPTILFLCRFPKECP